MLYCSGDRSAYFAKKACREILPLRFGGKNPYEILKQSNSDEPVNEDLLEAFQSYYETPLGKVLSFTREGATAVDKHFLKVMQLALLSSHPTYQNDGPIKAHAQKVFQKEFAGNLNEPVLVFFTPVGTAANRIGLTPVLRPIDSILAANNSHTYSREAGAYGKINNVAIVPFQNVKGKLSFEMVKQYMDLFNERNDWNYAGRSKPKVITITQPTEYGTVYTDEEVRKLANLAHQNGMLLHMDGSRLFYLAARTGKSLKALTTDLGVDILLLGGGKNKMISAESCVYTPNFFRNAKHYSRNDRLDELANDLRSYTKQQGANMAQGISPSVQFIFALEQKHAVETARNALYYADKLEALLLKYRDIHLFLPTETNAVLVSMPTPIANQLREKYELVSFPETDPERPENTLIRFVTNPVTQDKDLNKLEKFLDNLSLERK